MDLLVIILSCVSLILTLGGLYLVGEKNPIGWLVFIVSYAVQMFIFGISKNVFLIIQMVLLTYFSLINYLKWRKKDE
jgi:hypothetical protein